MTLSAILLSFLSGIPFNSSSSLLGYKLIGIAGGSHSINDLFTVSKSLALEFMLQGQPARDFWLR